MSKKLKDHPKRTWRDIKEIRLDANALKSGWVVEIIYKDSIGKSAIFSIDYGYETEDMLALALHSIRLQMNG